jgi:hypothetical protein
MTKPSEIDMNVSQSKMMLQWDDDKYQHVRYADIREIRQYCDAVYENITIGYFISLDFGRKFSEDECRKIVQRWMNRLARETKQHIHYQGSGGIQPIGSKNHVHLIVSCQTSHIPTATMQHLWLKTIQKYTSKDKNGKKTRPVSQIDFLDNSHEHRPSRYAEHNQEPLRNLYGCDAVPLDKSKNAGYYTLLHYFPVEGIGCPKTGACKYKVCKHKKNNELV